MATVTVDLTIDAITDYQDGQRLWAHESYEIQGEERKRYFVVWDNEGQDGEYSEGDLIHVQGLLSARTSEPNDNGDVFVQLSINSPRITVKGGAPALKGSSSRRSGTTSRSGTRSGARNSVSRRGSDTPPF